MSKFNIVIVGLTIVVMARTHKAAMVKAAHKLAAMRPVNHKPIVLTTLGTLFVS